MGKQIDQKQLAEDIMNTMKESSAYQKIAEGFYILANLPETEPDEKKKFMFESKKWDGLKLDCDGFLKELLDKADEIEFSKSLDK